MSGEADEDTMSAWSSPNGGGGSGSGLGSSAELGSGPVFSLQRRSSFGMKMGSFSEDPLLLELQSDQDQVTLDAELAQVGRGRAESGGMGSVFKDVVQRAKETLGEGGAVKARAASPRASVPTRGATETAAAAGTVAKIDGDGTEPSGDKTGVKPSPPPESESPGEGPVATASKTAVTATNGPAEETFAATSPTNGSRRRSNQDDQSNDSDSAKGGSSLTGGSVRGEEASREEGDENTLPSDAPGSVQTGGSDARCATCRDRLTLLNHLGFPPAGGLSAPYCSLEGNRE